MYIRLFIIPSSIFNMEYLFYDFKCKIKLHTILAHLASYFDFVERFKSVTFRNQWLIGVAGEGKDGILIIFLMIENTKCVVFIDVNLICITGSGTGFKNQSHIIQAVLSKKVNQIPHNQCPSLVNGV